MIWESPVDSLLWQPASSGSLQKCSVVVGKYEGGESLTYPSLLGIQYPPARLRLSLPYMAPERIQPFDARYILLGLPPVNVISF